MARFTTILLIALSSSLTTVIASDDVASEGGCADPLSAIMATLDCVEKGDAKCATKGYDGKNFIKLHNGIDTKTKIDDTDAYWSGAFTQVDFEFSYDHMTNLGPNMASVRYIEMVEFTDGTNYGFPKSSEYPWSYSFKQHEHAIVTVDDDCKIVLWDQYGDDVEQNYHYDTSAVVMNILCEKGIYPPPVCAMFGIDVAPDAVAGDAVVDHVEEEVEETCEKTGKTVKRLIRRYIKSKTDAILEGHRILSKQFPKKEKKSKDEL